MVSKRWLNHLRKLNKDYRRTNYCKEPSNILSVKKNMLEKIKKTKKTDNHYSLVKDKNNPLQNEFYTIYDKKCAYCGVTHQIISLEVFEIDHFIPKKHGGEDILDNLVLSCKTCNRLKQDFFKDSMLEKMHPDNDIIHFFNRNEKFKICINEEFLGDRDVSTFYDKLKLGYNLRRLDYLLLQVIALYSEMENLEDERRFLEYILLFGRLKNKLMNYRKCFKGDKFIQNLLPEYNN